MRTTLAVTITLIAGLSVWSATSGRRLWAQAAPIATVTLSPGWATFGEAVPSGVAHDGLQVGTQPTQTDVKTRWPDGSIRFAVVTVNAPATAAYDITPAATTPGTFTPFVPAAAVALTLGGVVYTATLPNLPATDLWLSGPLVYEGRTVVAPMSAADGRPHPFLRVNFDTRVYSDGKARVDVSVENLLDQVGATTVTYNVAIKVNGQVVFAKPAVQHYYLTRWRKVFEVGSGALAAVTPDITPFNMTRALPPYLGLVSNVVSAPIGLTYDILSSGALDPNMPAHGGRPELAPYPDWTARYLVHKNSTQRSFVLTNGDLSGSWPVHVREAEGSTKIGVGAERLVSLDQRPTVWYDERAQAAGFDFIKGTPLPIREYGLLTPGPGQTALIPDNAHQASLAYVPYLLTGDRYYAEEMAFWANYGMLRTYSGDGVRSSTGILAYNEVRGYGWALRNMVDAAAYYPDSSPVKAYLSQKVLNNLQWLDTYASAQNPVTNPFRVMWLGKRPEGAQYIALWEQTYLAHAIDRANKQGFVGGLAHRDAIAQFQLRLFTSDPEYPRAQAAPVILGVGTPNPTGFGFHTTMAQIWAATVGNERPFAGFYGPEARMTLMVGIERGWAGAQAAYDYLWPFIGVDSVSFPLSDLAQRAGWALDFASSASSPPSAGVSVPDVVGLTQVAATSAITAAGLTVGTVSTAFSATVTAGLISGESPAAGTSVAAGSAVTLVVSTSSPPVGVPNVVGLSQTAATTALTGAGLTVGTVSTASSTTVGAGLVSSESPAAGTSVAAGSAVTLVVSTGPPSVNVPNVVGLTQATATTAITAAGFVVGVVTSANSTTVAAGSVISQSPVAGASVAPGGAVALTLSTTIVITRADLTGGQLRLEGRGARPNQSILVAGIPLGTSDGAGAFKILAAFSSATCQVVVSDGLSNTTSTLAGCTPAGAPVLSSVTVSLTSVSGGTSAQGTVTMSAAASAATTVALSSNTAAAAVPASVTIAAAATSAMFTITTTPVTASAVATITAAAGGVTRTAALTLAPLAPPPPVTPPAPSVTLTVTATGRTGERVTSSPAGINVSVGSTGSASFATATTITLSVTNGRDAIWSGACSSGGARAKTCTFTLSNTATI